MKQRLWDELRPVPKGSRAFQPAPVAAEPVITEQTDGSDPHEAILTEEKMRGASFLDIPVKKRKLK